MVRLNLSIYHLFLWGLLASLAGCAGPSREIAPLPAVVREEFDPQTLNDDGFLLKPSDVAPVARIDRSPSSMPASPSSQADGYRVQIAAVLNRPRAETFRDEAEQKLGLPVYIYHDQETSLYKIQVGNGRTAREVEQLRRKAKNLGYGEAFIVRAKIEIAPAPVRRPAQTSGYRIQIFSASNQQAAENARSQAEKTLNRNDIYVEFEPPFFKVRIGNFQARKTAEEMMQQLKQQGYDTPFLVQTQILVSPE